MNTVVSLTIEANFFIRQKVDQIVQRLVLFFYAGVFFFKKPNYFATRSIWMSALFTVLTQLVVRTLPCATDSFVVAFNWPL